MATIDALPDYSVIKAFRHVLDYYVHRGTPCVRGWPRSPSGPRSAAVMASATTFANLSKALSQTDLAVRAQLEAAYGHASWTWKDAATAGQYGHTVQLV
jgi:hypothetical protein